MRITNVETILLTGPCTCDPFLSQARHRRSVAFIHICTDTEFTGLGETYAGYFCPEIVPEIVAFFKPILLGINPEKMDISQLWKRMYHCGNYWARVGLGAIVLSGIEAALWDLVGKILDKPVHEILGGAKFDSLNCYATGGPSNYPVETLLEKLEFYKQLGFNYAKIGAGTFRQETGFDISNDPKQAADVEASKFGYIKSHFGDSLDVMMDAHMGNSPDLIWNFETAKAVCEALEPFDLPFLEEPLHYTDPEGYSKLSKSTSIPIAGGECLTCQYEWEVFARCNAFDIGQPDASFTGGLCEFIAVAKMFAKRNRTIAPHAWGAGGSLMQNIHCGFVCENTLFLEIPPAFGPLHSEIVADSFIMKEGKVLPPQTAGLGIKLSHDIINRYPFEPGSGEYNSVPGKILPEEQWRKKQ